MNRLVSIVLVASLALGGCAARLKSSGTPPAAISAAAKANLVVTFIGTQQVEANTDWYPIKGTWSQALASNAAAAGYRTTFLAGRPQTQARDGLMVVIRVENFRYLTGAARAAGSFAIGNAWVNAHVDYKDLRTGRLLGSRQYDTKSKGWQMWFSAMTDKQLKAIARQMVQDIGQAR